MAYKSKEKKRAYARDYYLKNKEKINKQSRENYLQHRDETIQRTTKYHHEHKEWRQKYYKQDYQNKKLKVLAMIDPAKKCARCGCDDTRFLEINHIKGGGRKERKGFNENGKNYGYNMILLIFNGHRDTKDLNLLCKACNSLEYLEKVYGKTGLRVVWDKR